MPVHSIMLVREDTHANLPDNPPLTHTERGAEKPGGGTPGKAEIKPKQEDKNRLVVEHSARRSDAGGGVSSQRREAAGHASTPASTRMSVDVPSMATLNQSAKEKQMLRQLMMLSILSSNDKVCHSRLPHRLSD